MYRVYTKFFLWTVLIVILSFLSFHYFKGNIFSSPKNQTIAPAANTEPFEEGKHYKKLSAKITTSPIVQQFIAKDEGKIQVIEFFGYPCFWCYKLHPYLNEWAAKKSENIIFYRFPVYFNKGWDTLAKAYLVVEKLGKSSTLDKEFFLAIHKEHLDLSQEEKLLAFFQKHGVSEKQFKTLYDSFEINHAYTKANEIANAYEIIVSPAVVLNLPSGSYLITAAMAGSEQSVIDIIQFLIDRDLQDMSKSKNYQR